MDALETYNPRPHRIGDTFGGVVVRVWQPDGKTPYDLTSATFKAEFRKDTRGGTVADTFTLGSGISISGNSVTLEPFSLAAYSATDYPYSIRMVDTARTETLVAGTLEIHSNTTDLP